MAPLTGKVAIVTGSGRAIGRAVALKPASHGASVVVNDLDPGPADGVVEEIMAPGDSAIACTGSVTAPDFGERIIQAALDVFGGLDIIVNKTKTLAREWGRLKVCVNCVAFGFIETWMTSLSNDPANTVEIDGMALVLGVPEGAREAVTAQIPLGRLGTPQEAAGGVYFFCAPESDYVSGQTLLVARGLGA